MVDAFRQLRQQLVADRVPPAVVDDLEAVEVEEQDRVGGFLDGLTSERLCQSFGEERTVRQPGEPVVVGLIVQLFLQLGDLGERVF